MILLRHPAALRCQSISPDEKVAVLRRSIHRIDRQLDELHRRRPSPDLEREAEVLEAIVEDIRAELRP